MSETKYPDPVHSSKPFELHKVLDHGFVRLIRCMPDITSNWDVSPDQAIVQNARVSYGQGTKSSNDDKGLIEYLMRHRHTSPFECVQMTFHMRLPIFIARQFIRHRMFGVNEYSARYSEVPDLYYVPLVENIKGQDKNNKQGSSGELPEELRKEFAMFLNDVSDSCHQNYLHYLNFGISRETAREILPVNFYTEWYVTGDLHNFLHFLKLRCDSHAQYEIQEYANVVKEIIRQIAPITLTAWENYIQNSSSFAQDEIHMILSSLNSEKLRLLVEKSNLSAGRKKELLGKVAMS